MTSEESLFETYDDITEELAVLAPWFDDASSTIRHAEAVVITKVTKNIPLLYHYTHNNQSRE